MKTIYCTGVDCGYGSLDVEFFDDPKSIALLEDHDPERYRGEGGRQFSVPDDVVLTGIKILTVTDVQDLIRQDLDEDDEEE